MVGKIINVPKLLTKNQKETLDSLSKKRNTDKGITKKQQETLISLQYKEIQSKKYTLSDSQKKLLSELAFSENYGRKTTLNSSKITKGLEVEKASRDLLSRVTGLFLTNTTERKSNKWVTGLIDFEPADVIPDIKSSWSWKSFSGLIQEKPNEIYLRQGDSYMDLWQRESFLLCHILVDTPNKLVEAEIKKADYSKNILNIEGEVREQCIDEVKQIVVNHIFSREALEGFCDYSSNVYLEWFDDFNEIPEEKRVHMVSHNLDKERIEQRNECISISREFMNTVQPLNNFNKSLIS